jgi:hypothetical protein
MELVVTVEEGAASVASAARRDDLCELGGLMPNRMVAAAVNTGRQQGEKRESVGTRDPATHLALQVQDRIIW